MPEFVTEPILRIGLLKVDWVNEDLLSRHGDLPDMFGRFFRRQCAVAIDTFDVLNGILPDKHYPCSAFVITGSRFCAFKDLLMFAALSRFVRDALDKGSKVIGICFGHQFLAHVLNGRVEQNPFGWNVGLRPLQLHHHASWMSPQHPQLNLLFNHRDAVLEAPPDARILAGAPECPVQIFSIDTCCLGIQPHPEYKIDYQEALMKAATDLPSATRRDGVLRNRALSNDADHMLRWILQFIGLDASNESMRQPAAVMATP